MSGANGKLRDVPVIMQMCHCGERSDVAISYRKSPCERITPISAYVRSEWKINGCPGYHANVSLRGAQRRGNLLQKIVFFPLTFLTKDKYINVDEE